MRIDWNLSSAVLLLLANLTLEWAIESVFSPQFQSVLLVCSLKLLDPVKWNGECDLVTSFWTRLFIREKWANMAVELDLHQTCINHGRKCVQIRNANPACRGNFDGRYSQAFWNCYRKHIERREYETVWQACELDRLIAMNHANPFLVEMELRNFNYEEAVAFSCCNNFPLEKEIVEWLVLSTPDHKLAARNRPNIYLVDPILLQ